MMLSAIGAASLIIAVDVWLHRRYSPWLGYNVWGYRGPILNRKRSTEYRVALLGGSAAYGYAVSPSQTISVYLERRLRAMARSDDFTVVNLAYNNEGAYSFAFTLQDYRYLHCDLAILYEGYNDLTDDPRNTSVFRETSPVFRLTGYLPISPLIFREKAATLLHGDINALSPLYVANGKTVFRPSWTQRAQAEALQMAAGVEAALDRQLGAAAALPVARFAKTNTPSECPDVPNYCESVARAVNVARAAAMQVLVVTQPYALGSLRGRHKRQQLQMAAMLAHRYGADGNVGYVNLGESVDLSDERMSGDRMHTTADGNDRIATALIGPVGKMAAHSR
jgi:hypothetical protein